MASWNFSKDAGTAIYEERESDYDVPRRRGSDLTLHEDYQKLLELDLLQAGDPLRYMPDTGC